MKADADTKLLRRFEPVIHYTRGEKFFPMDVEPYVNSCSLWMQKPGRQPVCLVPEGELELYTLSQPRVDGFGTVYYLKFIEPLNIPELAAYALQEGLKKKDPKDVFHAGRGRLARVGYFSRFIDALFTLTLLARGRVPGDTAAAAAQAYHRIMQTGKHYRYFGRVVRQNNWTILQYWYFYPFNDWRTGFFGANDHEADWEMVCVYLSETEGEDLSPEWVAYASHDFFGDDLRRRWDDPELEKLGEHPVIYCGAGSHASYFAPGEYLTEIELPFLSPVVRLTERIHHSWRQLLRYTQREDDDEEEIEDLEPGGPTFHIFRIPFVDYARGDGLSIGPGCDKEWDEPHLLSPPPEWAIHYRGLWGVYVRDPFAGENAPAGPVYNRDGTVRRSWYDPLGWSGLDKVPPANKALKIVLQRQIDIENQRENLARKINEKTQELTNLGVELASMTGHPHMVAIHTSHQQRISSLSNELKELRAEFASDGSILETLEQYASQLRRGDHGPARAHIRRAHRPASDLGLRLSRIAESWAAISIGIVMLSFVGTVFFARQYLIWGLLAIIGIIVFVEAGFRRRLIYLTNNLTIGLAAVSTLILFIEFFWTILIVTVILAGVYITWENIKELRT